MSPNSLRNLRHVWTAKSRYKLSATRRRMFRERPEMRQEIGEQTRRNWRDPAIRARNIENRHGRTGKLNAVIKLCGELAKKSQISGKTVVCRRADIQAT